MSMAIKGLYSSDWLYTQTPPPRISFPQPWHRWHRALARKICNERRTGTKEARKNGVVRRNIERGGEEKRKEEHLTFPTSRRVRLWELWFGFERMQRGGVKKHQKKQFSLWEPVWKSSRRRTDAPPSNEHELFLCVYVPLCCQRFNYPRYLWTMSPWRWSFLIRRYSTNANENPIIIICRCSQKLHFLQFILCIHAAA